MYLKYLYLAIVNWLLQSSKFVFSQSSLYFCPSRSSQMYCEMQLIFNCSLHTDYPLVCVFVYVDLYLPTSFSYYSLAITGFVSVDSVFFSPRSPQVNDNILPFPFYVWLSLVSASSPSFIHNAESNRLFTFKNEYCLTKDAPFSVCIHSRELCCSHALLCVGGGLLKMAM